MVVVERGMPVNVLVSVKNIGNIDHLFSIKSSISTAQSSPSQLPLSVGQTGESLNTVDTSGLNSLTNYYDRTFTPAEITWEIGSDGGYIDKSFVTPVISLGGSVFVDALEFRLRGKADIVWGGPKYHPVWVAVEGSEDGLTWFNLSSLWKTTLSSPVDEFSWWGFDGTTRYWFYWISEKTGEMQGGRIPETADDFYPIIEPIGKVASYIRAKLFMAFDAGNGAAGKFCIQRSVHYTGAPTYIKVIGYNATGFDATASVFDGGQVLDSKTAAEKVYVV